jgi:hypothetical protein
MCSEHRSWGTVIAVVISSFIVVTLLGIMIILIVRMRRGAITSSPPPVPVRFADPVVMTEEALETETNNALYDNGKMSNQLID